MRSVKMVLLLSSVCLLTICGQAQSQDPDRDPATLIEYGDPSELRGITKLYIDTQNDAASGIAIVTEIRKKLPKLQFVAKPEETDFHLRFYYEPDPSTTNGPYPPYANMPVASVVKIMGKDHIRVLMGYRAPYPYGPRIGAIWGWGMGRRYNPEAEFAKKFVKAYQEANSKSAGGAKQAS